MKKILMILVCAVAALLVLEHFAGAQTTSSTVQAKDPGPRAGSVNAGQPPSGLTASQLAYFQDGLNRFNEVDAVANGLGPTYNSTSCASCHAQPAVGGSSPSHGGLPQLGIESAGCCS